MTGNQAFLNQTDVTTAIHNPNISKIVRVSAVSSVRRKLVEVQIMYATETILVVMDGRDIGTVVFPDAV